MKNKKQSLLRKYKLGTKKKVLPKYMFGMGSFGGMDFGSSGFSTDPITGGGGEVDINNYTFDEGALMDTQGGDYWDPAYEGSSNQKSENSSEISSGIASGLNAVGSGLNAAAAAQQAKNQSGIDPSNIYAYDQSKSIWAEELKNAETTADTLDMTGDVLNSIPLGFTQIIAAGLKTGAGATRKGRQDLIERDRQGHEEYYAQRRNIGGSRGNFTTQGQFTTYDNPGNLEQVKMGGYLDKYRGGGLYANIHNKRARIKKGSGESMRKPGSKGAPSAQDFKDAAKTAKKGMGGYLKSYQMGSTGKPSTYMDALASMPKDSIINPRYPSDTDVAMSRLEEMFPFLQYGNKDYSREEYQKATEGARLYLNAPMTDQKRIEREKNTVAAKPLTTFELMKRDNVGYYKQPTKMDETGLRPETPNRYTARQMQLDADNRNSGIEVYKNGGKLPKDVLKSRLESHMSDSQAQSYLSKYKSGGVSVSRGVSEKNATAELEGGETVLGADGDITLVQGPSHERGGVPYKLKEGGLSRGGDYVFSDHLKTQDPQSGEIMSMAELHLKYKDNPEMVEWVMQTQEQLAGRENTPTDQMAMEPVAEKGYGGMLKKYQSGSVGKRTFLEQAGDYVPEIASGIGALAQTIATATAKNPYEGIKAPTSKDITVEKQFFEKTDSRAEEAANTRASVLSKELLAEAGAGASEIAAFQKIDLDRAEADAKAVERAREFNIRQDTAEKQLYTEAKLRADIANQKAKNDMAILAYERALNEQGFETERGQAIGASIAGMAKDVANYASDYRYARAIQGDAMAKRGRTYDRNKAVDFFMSETPFEAWKKSNPTGTRPQYEKFIETKVNADEAKHIESLRK